ncbi:MAG: hypothetical protein K0Q75_1319 [Anaerospora sp.]|nr:hypothetical protein [Anaerospora sp.]
MFANLRNIEKIKLLVIGLFMVLILGSYAQFVMQVGFSNANTTFAKGAR